MDGGCVDKDDMASAVRLRSTLDVLNGPRAWLEAVTNHDRGASSRKPYELPLCDLYWFKGERELLTVLLPAPAAPRTLKRPLLSPQSLPVFGKHTK